MADKRKTKRFEPIFKLTSLFIYSSKISSQNTAIKF